MRVRQATARKQKIKSTSSTKEPLVEEFARKKRRPRDFFTKMSDDELVEYGRDIVKRNNIMCTTDLKNADSGLHEALRKRRLVERVIFRRKKAKPKKWNHLNNHLLVIHSQKFIDENDIKNRYGLAKKANSLYNELRKRRLLKKLFFQEKKIHGKWAQLSNDELISFARTFVDKEKITGKKQLRKRNGGLYSALWGRKLLNKIGFQNNFVDWASMENNQILIRAKEYIQKNKITGRHQLSKRNLSLYAILLRRGLLDRIGLNSKRRWASLNDEELIQYTRKFIEGKEADGKRYLCTKDKGLYSVLLRRKLLDQVLSEIEESKQHQLQAGLQQAADAMEEFGDQG
jgi:hypothetical protein